MRRELKGVSNVLRILGGISNKTMAEYLFDFANTTNPTGGITGPDNSIWFQNLMLKVFGVVSDGLKKVLKNYACIHDACGLLFKCLGVGPGYTYAMPASKVITVSSAGSGSGSLLGQCCWLGQLTGLWSVWCHMVKYKSGIEKEKVSEELHSTDTVFYVYDDIDNCR